MKYHGMGAERLRLFKNRIKYVYRRERKRANISMLVCRPGSCLLHPPTVVAAHL
jgi:hypothetical protein